mmetsp:Transcript_68604/g.217017  ORF Transcript_68604/g.217017 Transcript_68604/m.217017 type:complete len:90 (-) Transcript_68604:621-890(-)
MLRAYAAKYITPGRPDPIYHVCGTIFTAMFAFECVHHAEIHGHAAHAEAGPTGAAAAASAPASAAGAAAGKAGTVVIVDMDKKTVKVHT